MALVPYRGGGIGGGSGGGGLGSGCLHHLIEMVVVALVLGALIQGGALENLARNVVGLTDHVVSAVRILVGGVAVMAVMVGGIIAISPMHRRFGYEVLIGGLVALVLTAFGPTIVADVQNALPAQPSTVVGSAGIEPSTREAGRL